MPEPSSKVSFRSKKQHKLDPKGRISFPKGWNVLPESTLYMLRSKSRDGAATSENPGEVYRVVQCYTSDGFEDMLVRLRRNEIAKGRSEEEVDCLVEHYNTFVEETDVTSQNKMVIPKDVREHLGLKGLVVLAGRGDHFDLWNPDDYAAAYPGADDAAVLIVRPVSVNIVSYSA